MMKRICNEAIINFGHTINLHTSERHSECTQVYDVRYVMSMDYQ
jgi:hypothetical protein